MAVYSIKDLEKLSGVKAHTLRIWEKRYGIINPKRTETNIRYYLDDDLKHILNITFLNRKGMKISKIASLKKEDIAHKVAEHTEVDVEFENQLDGLTLSLLELNEYQFDKIIETNIKQKGFKETMLEVIYPLLDKLSTMWMTGSINTSHERFVSNIIRRKTISAIDRLEITRDKSAKKFLIYLPEHENHELSLLFLHFLIKEKKFSVINLGLNIGLLELQDAYNISNPNYIFTIINDSFTEKPLQPYINSLEKEFNNSTILLTGIQLITQKIKTNKNGLILSSLSEVIQYLDEL